MTEAEVRQHLINAMHADFIGPFVPDDSPEGGQEVLPLPPSRWYLTGFLAPQGGVDPEPDDEDADGELAAGEESQAEDAGNAEPETKRRHRFPASMGLSVFLPAATDETDTITVTVRYAYYDKVDIAEGHEKQQKTGWQRVPMKPQAMKIPLPARSRAGKNALALLI